MTPKPPTKDNSTYTRKVALRRLALDLLQPPLPEPNSRFSLLEMEDVPRRVVEPVVMETHGGFGRLYLETYRDVRQGCVFETDEKKSGILAAQRPTWAVYQSDCVRSLLAGAGSHLAVNVLDVDPYGDPWPVIEAFFVSDRPRPARLVVVVNDGMRRNTRFGLSWRSRSLQSVVDRRGNDIFDHYLEVCEELMTEKAAQAGYALSRFSGYYCGAKEQMTHYLAVMVRE